MITVLRIGQVAPGLYDEVWAVVRSDKKILKGAIHVPQLSPSWKLFSEYRTLKESGTWTKAAFQYQYVPQFLNEMMAPAAQEKLKELIDKSQMGKRICIYCFCPDESMCHTSILAGILQEVTDVEGVSCDYSDYGKRYWAGMPKKLEQEQAPIKGVCFTGPRPKELCGYSRDKYRAFIGELAEHLERYYARGAREFYSGGAQGFDQLAFWAVHELKKKHGDVKNIVCQPFEGQETIWPKKGCFSQDDYQKMLGVADEVRCLLDEKPETKKQAAHALFIRNDYMVNHADLVVALSNEDGWQSAYGGTAACMQYASRRAKPIHRVLYGTDPRLSISDIQAI